MPLSGESVEIQLAGLTIETANRYQVHSGIFTQPSAFEVELESSQLVTDMLLQATPGKEFKLLVNGHVQFEGIVDSVSAHGSVSGGDVFTLRGRDDLAPLHDGDVDVDKDYADLNPTQILVIALQAVGFTEATILTDWAESRKDRSGSAIITKPISEVSGRAKAVKSKRRKQHVGETWYRFVQREVEHSGLYLWAAPGRKTFVLSAPNIDQAPIARIYRLPSIGSSNVKSYELVNDTTSRAAKYQVLGRNGGRKSGPGIEGGVIPDSEMQFYGFSKQKVIRDTDVTSGDEADFYAARKISEARRHGYSLKYTVAGHTTPSIDGAGTVVWTPDTMIQVNDEVLGIAEPMYLENVIFTQDNDGGTKTELRLMRKSDIAFASAVALSDALVIAQAEPIDQQEANAPPLEAEQ